MSNIVIPKGKRVLFRNYDSSQSYYKSASNVNLKANSKNMIESIEDTTFILSSPFSPAVKSSFKPFMNYSPNTAQILIQQLGQMLPESTGKKVLDGLIDITQKVTEVVGGYYDWMGMKIWSSTEPIDCTINLEALPTAKQKNIYVPIKELMKLTVPSVSKNTEVLGQKPLIFPGPNIFEEMVNTYGASASAKDYSHTAKGSLTICVGNMIFTDVIINSVTPVFNGDLTNGAYPVSASITVDFSTNKIATDMMIDQIFGGYEA